MQQIGIIGLGLIGSSIGMGLRKWAAADGKQKVEIVGFDIDVANERYAKGKLNAVDRTIGSLPAIAEACDLLIIATPVRAMRDVFEIIAPHLREGATITDTGSTKAEVLAWADELLPRTVSFVGSHPMAGKTRGLEGASAELFTGATWVVIPTVNAGDAAVQNVVGLVSALGATPRFLDATEHDAYVAGISHLPLATSAALVHAISSDASWRDMKTLTAGGFRDATRLAAGDPIMSRDIFLTNRVGIARWLDRQIDELEKLRALLTDPGEESEQRIEEWFVQARDSRAEWSTQEGKSGELLQSTDEELNEDMKASFGRLFFGNIASRKRKLPGLNDPPSRRPS
jgi:prephenate dehydrogenase